MSQKLDIEEIKEKMLKKLEPSGWSRVFKSFIESRDFENIIYALAKQARDGKRFTPTLKHLFRAFEECPYDELKVIMLGQDPYPGFGQADGIAFSLSNSREIQPSLDYIFKEVNRTVYDGVNVCKDMDLTRWSNQGVLLLNTALTTTVGKIGQHYLIWRPFIAYILDWLSWNCPGMVYVYFGKKAEEWADCVNDNNYKFYLTHPASAAYNAYTEWDSKNVFPQVAEILKKQYNFDIIW